LRNFKSMFPSEAKGAQKARTLRRISRDSLPELVEAMRAGRLPLAWADEISRLPRRKQAKALALRLEEREKRGVCERGAARVIAGYLDRGCDGPPDLEEVAQILREALV
jgi:hypothetical protein